MRRASSESESNRHSIIDCQSARGLNKHWHFNYLPLVFLPALKKHSFSAFGLHLPCH